MAAAGWPPASSRSQDLPLLRIATCSALTEGSDTEKGPSGSTLKGADPEVLAPRTGRDSRADRPGLAPRWLQRDAQGGEVEDKTGSQRPTAMRPPGRPASAAAVAQGQPRRR